MGHGTNGHGARPKVLIADDEPGIRGVLCETVAGFGYDVEEAPDGAAAWRALSRPNSPIRIAILDVRMPALDGFSLCRRIRAELTDPYVYVILLTALSQPSHFSEGMAAGADDFLTKPFQVEHLGARLGVARRILRLEEEVRELSRLLPICMYCRRVQDETGRWTPVELYLASRGMSEMTHGMCADCSAVARTQV
jgi:DNA-binding response OmpR family regulator